MESELDRFLEEEFPAIKTHGDRIIEKAEREFVSGTAEYQSREQEKKDIRAQIKDVKQKLNKCKNVKNHRFREVNAKRAAKRADYRNKIEYLNLRLREIGIEEDQVRENIEG